MKKLTTLRITCGGIRVRLAESNAELVKSVRDLCAGFRSWGLGSIYIRMAKPVSYSFHVIPSMPGAASRVKA